jgi:hypothetical protein
MNVDDLTAKYIELRERKLSPLWSLGGTSHVHGDVPASECKNIEAGANQDGAHRHAVGVKSGKQTLPNDQRS